MRDWSKIRHMAAHHWREILRDISRYRHLDKDHYRAAFYLRWREALPPRSMEASRQRRATKAAKRARVAEEHARAAAKARAALRAKGVADVDSLRKSTSAYLWTPTPNPRPPSPPPVWAGAPTAVCPACGLHVEVIGRRFAYHMPPLTKLRDPAVDLGVVGNQCHESGMVVRRVQ